MKTLLLAGVLALMVGCASSDVVAPRFKVGDRVTTPAGIGTITKVLVKHQYEVKHDDLKDEDGNDIIGTWGEDPQKPFDGVKKLGK